MAVHDFLDMWVRRRQDLVEFLWAGMGGAKEYYAMCSQGTLGAIAEEVKL